MAGDYLEVSSSACQLIEKHVMNTCKMAFYYLRNIARIRNCLSQDDAETLVRAFISSKLDFCDALLYGLPKSVIDRLQYVQNCAARLVTRTRNSKHIATVLRGLHWLPVRQRTSYKILLPTCKALAPRYVDHLQPSLRRGNYDQKAFACNTEVEPQVLQR